jgi:DNA-binding transcriptional LysR family regulator
MDAPVPLSRIGAARMIMPGRHNAIRAYIENAVTRAGQTFHNHIEAETLSLCVELVRSGLGSTAMPYCAFRGRLEESIELKGAPIRGLSLGWNLCVNRARIHSVAVRSLARLLRDFVEAQIRSGNWAVVESMNK